jgi:prevent-host-death family protein
MVPRATIVLPSSCPGTYERRPHHPYVVTDPRYNDYMEVGVRDLKARLSEYLERVERGEVIDVTSRGRPIARLMPIPGRGNVERGLAEGWITRLADRPPEPVARQRPLPGTRTTTELIREDRDA